MGFITLHKMNFSTFYAPVTTRQESYSVRGLVKYRLQKVLIASKSIVSTRSSANQFDSWLMTGECRIFRGCRKKPSTTRMERTALSCEHEASASIFDGPHAALVAADKAFSKIYLHEGVFVQAHHRLFQRWRFISECGHTAHCLKIWWSLWSPYCNVLRAPHLQIPSSLHYTAFY